MGDTEIGTCEICKKEGPVQRTYFHYDFKCECHSPNHFEIVWHCSECEPKKPEVMITILKNDKPS
ncbi:MAG: hypothetical protein AABY15_02890 [Nanoarchaeota archaeon]